MSNDQSAIDRVRALPFEARNRRFVQYLLVGLVGISINESVLYLTTGVVGLSYVIGGFLGRAVSTFVNFVLNDRWTWRAYGDPGRRQWLWRAVKYGTTRLVGIALGVAVLVALVEFVGLHYLVANIVAIGVGVLWGFDASDRFVWQVRHETGTVRVPGWAVLRERLVAIDRPTRLVVAFSAALFVLFSIFTVQLYRGYWMTGSDFGSYVHMFSTTLDGQGFLIHGKYRLSHPGGSYWGAHFSLTLLLFLPLFALVRSPMTLLVAKSFLLAASVLALWFVARTHIESDRLAGALVVSYALNPFLWSAWLFDFQEQSLLPLFVFGAYYMYARRRYAAFLVLLTMVLLTNEFVIFIVFGALSGLTVAAYRGGRLTTERWVLLVGFVLVVLVHYLSGAIIAQFSLYSGVPYASIAGPFKPFIGPRTGVSDLLTLGARNPQLIVDALAANISNKLIYFVIFLVPVAFLSLSDEISVGALAPYLLFSWLFAGRGIYFMFGAHYPLYLLPFLYIGAVRVAGRVAVLPPSEEVLLRLISTVVVLSLITGVAVGVSLNVVPVPTQNEHTNTLEMAIDGIPTEASLLTQNDIYPHVAMRPHATYVVRPDMFHQYQREYGSIAPEYVLYDTQLTGRPFDWSHSVRTAFGDRLGTEYGLYQYQDGIRVYKRGYRGPINAIDGTYDFDERFDAREFKVSKKNARTVGGTIIGSGGAAKGNLWFGPFIELPPGTYTASYRVNVKSDGDAPPLLLNVATGRNSRVVTERAVGTTDGWEDVTLSFTLDRPTSGVEFRGAQSGGAGTVRFDSVRVVLQSTDLDASSSATAETADSSVDNHPWMTLHASRNTAEDSSGDVSGTAVGNVSIELDQSADGNHTLDMNQSVAANHTVSEDTTTESDGDSESQPTESPLEQPAAEPSSEPPVRPLRAAAVNSSFAVVTKP